MIPSLPLRVLTRRTLAFLLTANQQRVTIRGARTRWTRAAGACFSTCLVGRRGFDSRRRVNFYEAGSGQEVIRVDWFTLLFKVTRITKDLVSCFSWPQSTVRRSSFSTARFALKLTRELFVISIRFPNLLFTHLSLNEIAQAIFRSSSADATLESTQAVDKSYPPGPHLRDRSSVSATTGLRRRLEVISPLSLMTQHGPASH